MTRDEHAALAGMYRLLARIWLREIDPAFLEELSSPPLCDVFAEAAGILPAADIESLAIEYCRLFVGPADHLPPYQSVWQTGQLQGKTATSMKQFAEVIGYDTESIAGTMLDHLGVQLDMMAALESQYSEDARDLRDQFFAKHLYWADRLFSAAASKASSDFYRSVIQLTRDFLASERSD